MDLEFKLLCQHLAQNSVHFILMSPNRTPSKQAYTSKFSVKIDVALKNKGFYIKVMNCFASISTFWYAGLVLKFFIIFLHFSYAHKLCQFPSYSQIFINFSYIIHRDLVQVTRRWPEIRKGRIGQQELVGQLREAQKQVQSTRISPIAFSGKLKIKKSQDKTSGNIQGSLKRPMNKIIDSESAQEVKKGCRDRTWYVGPDWNVIHWTQQHQGQGK